MENACLAELGMSEERNETVDRIEEWRDKDRIQKLEEDIKILDGTITSLNRTVNSLWDSIEYVSENVEALQSQTKMLATVNQYLLDGDMEGARDEFDMSFWGHCL
ncbi:hypothetical protein, partial [Burkholderia sp. SIMBA_024]